MSDLLARFAESAFWLARYMERADNLARIIDVNETFARDSETAVDWLPIVEINADSESFFAKHDEAVAEAVIDFYVRDLDNPTSIISSVRSARENARMVRHLISTEMWLHLNVFYGELRELSGESLGLSDLPDLCALVKEHCQTHVGITEGTLYRDQVWSFHELGRHLERADQTTRMLDIKYRRLLPSPELVGSPLDVGQWNAVLRSAAGYHAFRRVHPSGMRPETVAGFLLFDRDFPRSVTLSLQRASELLDGLSLRYGLAGGRPAEILQSLRARLQSDRIGVVIAEGLHEYLDDIQFRIIEITEEMGLRFFGHEQTAA
ncbi:MAG TPA: alpha-E domain-containing protein [Kiloniellales bacterium]|nr:alpha-E domain-containing protein [Kiloniellales bacterium]